MTDAFREPRVDHDLQRELEWNAPNLNGLRTFAERELGWSAEYTDRQMLPVVRKAFLGTESETANTSGQSLIGDFFLPDLVPAGGPIAETSRLGAAVTKVLAAQASARQSGIITTLESQQTRSTARRKRKSQSQVHTVSNKDLERKR